MIKGPMAVKYTPTSHNCLNYILSNTLMDHIHIFNMSVLPAEGKETQEEGDHRAALYSVALSGSAALIRPPAMKKKTLVCVNR